MTFEEELAASDAMLRAERHTEECVKFWHDVMLMDRIGERWDHWTQPTCIACTARRVRKADA